MTIHLVGASLLLLVSLWIFGSRVKARFQSRDSAINYVQRKLEKSGSTAPVAVRLWEAHPLSTVQIKDLARDRGFVLADTSSDGGSSYTLKFLPSTANRSSHA